LGPSPKGRKHGIKGGAAEEILTKWKLSCPSTNKKKVLGGRKNSPTAQGDATRRGSGFQLNHAIEWLFSGTDEKKRNKIEGWGSPQTGYHSNHEKKRGERNALKDKRLGSR